MSPIGTRSPGRFLPLACLGILLPCGNPAMASSPDAKQATASLASISTSRVYPRLSFDLPVALVQAPRDNARWYVLEQGGVIRQFRNVADPAFSRIVLDLRDRVECCDEAGLLDRGRRAREPGARLDSLTRRPRRGCAYGGIRVN